MIEPITLDRESSLQDIVKDTTCFAEHKKRGLTCEKKSCPNWMNREDCLNCAIVGSQSRKWILKDIGELFGVTRMRICQIEKEVIVKLNKLIKIN